MVRMRRRLPARRRLGRVARARAIRRLRSKRRLHTARNPVGHQFTRIAYSQNALQFNAGVPTNTFGAVVFKLSDLPNYQEFTELYDLYKINKVKYTIIPKINSATLNGSVQMPIIHSVIDSNDNTAFTTLAQMMENEDVKTTRGVVPHSRYFTPKCQTKLYESLGTDGYATMRRNPFINTEDPSVPHYALKWAIENPISGGDAYWYADIRIKFYLSFREVQ